MPRHSSLQDSPAQHAAEYYRQAFAAVSNGIVVLEILAPARFDIVAVNPGFEFLTGLRAADGIGLSIDASGVGAAALPSLQDCEQCVATRVPLERVVPATRTRASALQLRLTPLADASDRITHLVGELWEVDTVSAVNGTIGPEHTEAHFEALVESAPDLISRYSPEGRILYINPAAERALGARLEQVRGRYWRDLMPSTDDATRFYSLLMTVIRTRQPQAAEFHSSRAGTKVWYHVRFVPEYDGDDLISVLTIGRDITRQKRADDLAREWSEKFRNLIELAPDPIARYDADGRIQYLNPPLQRLVGLELAQVRGKLPSEAGVGGPSSRQIEQAIEEVVRLRAPLEKELFISEFPGGPLWHQLRFVPELDDEGRVVSVLVVGRDIASIKRTEELLRQREREFRTLSEHSPDFIARFDMHGDMIYANPMVQRLNDIGFEELRTKPPQDAEPLRRAIAEVARTGTAVEIELNLRPLSTRDDSPVWHQIRLVPELDGTGKVGSVLSIGRDITRLKQAEEQLRQREREFRTLAENSPDVISRFDRDGRCIYINPAVTVFTGLPTQRFIGTRPGDLTAEHGWEEVNNSRLLAAVRRTFATGVVQKEEMEFPGHRSIQFEIVPECTEDGSIVSVLGIARDITELRRSEAATRQLNEALEERVAARTAELECANRELETFSYTVSHDLRAPLRLINSFVHLLLEHEQERLSGAARRMLEHIAAAGGKLGKLVEDILEYSRAGHAALVLRPVSMSTLARDITAGLRLEYPRSEVSIDNLPDADGDPTMLRQVLQNLIGNALKFSSRQPQPRVAIGAVEDEGQTVYYVNDNGVGFDMRYVDQLFGVFQRLHSDRDFPGTGAGLAIVKRLVERHGGRVWVESKPNIGTTFRFTLRAG